MKGIVLAGGTGSRLFPLTKVTNKHLLPVGREPMIFHPVRKLTAAGIEEILIFTGVEHMGDVVTLLGSGKDFGCRFTYKVQDEAGGIAQALGLAENFAGRDPCCVILGDNIFESSIAPNVRAFAAQGEALLLDRLTAVAGSCGPGSLHFINGLYEANRNRAPVFLIASQVTRSELGFEPSALEDALAETLAWYQVRRPSHPGYVERPKELELAAGL